MKAPKKRKITVMDGDSGPRKDQDLDDDLALVAPVPGGFPMVLGKTKMKPKKKASLE